MADFGHYPSSTKDQLRYVISSSLKLLDISVSKLYIALYLAFVLTTASAFADNKQKTQWIYFCISKNPQSRDDGQRRRYGIKVVENDSIARSVEAGAILLRAYDWRHKNAAFRLERGEIKRFGITGVSQGCAKYGWEAINQNYRVVMCTATQGIADIEIFDRTTGKRVFQAECDHVWVD
jgi:hypothetical protein